MDCSLSSAAVQKYSETGLLISTSVLYLGKNRKSKNRRENTYVDSQSAYPYVCTDVKPAAIRARARCALLRIHAGIRSRLSQLLPFRCNSTL